MGLFDLAGTLGHAVKNLGKGIGDALETTAAVMAAPVVAAEELVSHLADVGQQALTGLSEWFDEIGGDELLASAHSPILLAGQVTIAKMRRTTGSGEPDDGAQFGTAAQRFSDAAQVLAGAMPSSDWTGDASGAYAADNDRQGTRATAMGHADDGVHQVLAREAAQIKSTRGKLDDQSNWLADVGRTTLTMLLVPGLGLAAKMAAEAAAVRSAVGACEGELTALRGLVSANAGAISGLTGQYPVLADRIEGGLPSPGSGSPGGGYGSRGGDGTGGAGSGGGARSGGGSGGGTGSGGGGSSAGGSSPSVPAVPMPRMPQTTSGAGPGTSSGPPAGGGGSPSGGAPSAAGAGGGPTGLAEMVQAAVQRAMDQRDAVEADDVENADDDQKDSDEDGIPDAEDEDADGDGVLDADEDAIPDAEDEDADGDGVPEMVMVATAGPDAAPAGPAPVHLGFDVGPDRLGAPTNVTLDRDRSIEVPPTTAT